MIYCVEDDGSIRNLMLYTLTASGFENSEAFYEALESKTPELVMLDIMLPGEDGLSILKRLRARADTADTPVILATAKGTEFDKVTGLGLSIVKHAAAVLGASIDLQSKPGEGTSITVRFPKNNTTVS